MPEDDPDIVFLSSSLNNMLVCGILKGIHLSLASADSKSDIDYIKNWQEHTDSSEGSRQSLTLRSRESSLTKFDSVEILDPKILENLSLDDVRNIVNAIKTTDKRRENKSLSLHYSLAAKFNQSHFNAEQSRKTNRSGSESLKSISRLSEVIKDIQMQDN